MCPCMGSQPIQTQQPCCTKSLLSQKGPALSTLKPCSQLLAGNLSPSAFICIVPAVLWLFNINVCSQKQLFKATVRALPYLPVPLQLKHMKHVCVCHVQSAAVTAWGLRETRAFLVVSGFLLLCLKPLYVLSKCLSFDASSGRILVNALGGYLFCLSLTQERGKESLFFPLLLSSPENLQFDPFEVNGLCESPGF